MTLKRTNEIVFNLFAGQSKLACFFVLFSHATPLPTLEFALDCTLRIVWISPDKMSKRKVLTLDERVRVLELSKVKSARKIADELGVGKTQIQNILKRKAEVLDDIENNVSGDRKRARKKTGNEGINDLVLQWFKDAMYHRLPVSGPILSKQALKFASELNNMTFKASTGWLASFLSRNNIVLGTMSGERGDVSKDTVEEWKKQLPTVCDGYPPTTFSIWMRLDYFSVTQVGNPIILKVT